MEERHTRLRVLTPGRALAPSTRAARAAAPADAAAGAPGQFTQSGEKITYTL
ncbi:hypothetical protein F750_3687 [Streptomyces sp. PAMC 26508]|nr:hypothetical protein F750_3687 [Streptomyces sp. PAMC 26508]